MGHRPFLVLADHLTRQGIAVLRSDDRGVGGSGGDFSTATTRDFAADAAAAVAWLRGRPEVDGSAVGLVGHSEGGIVAPMVAVERGGVDFVVLLAGPGLSGEEILYLQGAAVSRAMGAPEPVVERTLELQRRLFGVVRSIEDQTRRTTGLREELQAILDETPAAERPALGIPPGQEENWIQAQVTSLSTPWFRYFLLHDPADDLRNLRIPVLALLGGKDLQVPPEANAAAIRAALESGGNPDPTVEVLEGLNHLFQRATTGSPAEYSQIQETFAPAALERVSDWILERTGQRGGGGG
jgi:pimeloyl-ACP methyl ester carboxylesterase